MKLRLILSFSLLFATLTLARAGDLPATAPATAPAATVTLKGTLECGKCELHVTDDCSNCLVVKTGDKSETYFLADNDITKDSHADICMSPKDGVTCTGTVTEKDGKKWLTCTKMEGNK